jgi:hypothetical protein
MNASEKRELRRKIDAGLKASIAAALDEHRRAGRLVAVWRGGQVRLVEPKVKLPRATDPSAH